MLDANQMLAIAVSAGIGAGVAALFKAPSQIHAYMSERVRRQDAAKQEHAAQTELIETLRKELFPNGGSSLRDAVDDSKRATAQSLEIAQEGIAVAKQVRQEMFNHLEWHAEKQ